MPVSVCIFGEGILISSDLGVGDSEPSYVKDH